MENIEDLLAHYRSDIAYSSPDELYKLGLNHENLGNREAAVRHFVTLLKMEPDNISLFHKIARLFIELKEPARAVIVLHASVLSLKSISDFVVICEDLLDSSMDEGDSVKYRSRLGLLEAIPRMDVVTSLNDSQFKKIERPFCYLEFGEYEMALAIFQSVKSAENELQPAVNYGIGLCYLRLANQSGDLAEIKKGINHLEISRTLHLTAQVAFMLGTGYKMKYELTRDFADRDAAYCNYDLASTLDSRLESRRKEAFAEILLTDAKSGFRRE